MTWVLAIACSNGADPPDASVEAASDAIDAPAYDTGLIDTGVDTGPADTGIPPLMCVDAAEPTEPNESEIFAAAQPTIDDCDSSATSWSAISSGMGDLDWMRFTGKDTTLCSVDPTFKLDVGGVRLCAFAMCVVGATTIQSCSNGQPATSPAGTKGCCTSTPTSTMKIQMNCTGTDESANIFVRIDQPTSNTCIPYKLDYHY